eukprot:1234357-Alexandrium_andersonii.AAC.1
MPFRAPDCTTHSASQRIATAALASTVPHAAVEAIRFRAGGPVHRAGLRQLPIRPSRASSTAASGERGQ